MLFGKHGAVRGLLKNLRGDRSHGGGRILFTRAPLGPLFILTLRALTVVALFGVVLVVFYFDRDGLKDAADNAVSLADVVYFTMVTVTTVGYGDIVPVSPSARMIDALLVTPIRIFVWFIFVGTAYQLVIQRVIEDWRMQGLQRRLTDHVVICGFSNSGKSAASEFLARGIAPENIVVIDRDEHEIRNAVDMELVGLHGDVTREELLRVAGVERARGLIVAVGRDDTALMVVVTARAIGAKGRIVASVHERENVKLLKNAGADAVITPWTFGGYLLADAITQLHTVDLIQDALSHDGRLALHEREPNPAEIGLRTRDVPFALVYGVVRDGRRVMFWENPELLISSGDQLIVVDVLPQPRTAGR